MSHPLSYGAPLTLRHRVARRLRSAINLVLAASAAWNAGRVIGQAARLVPWAAPATVPVHAVERRAVVRELRRLSDSMLAARTRAGAFPSRLPAGFRPQDGIRMRVDRGGADWRGFARHRAGVVCTVAVRVERPRRRRATARERIRCADQSGALVR